MGWCLSTGTTWIFGVVHAEIDLSEDCTTYTIHSTEPVSLKDVGTDESKDNVSSVFWALVYWVSGTLAIPQH